MINKKAEIGIILLACNFLTFVLPLIWLNSLPLTHRFLSQIASNTLLMLQNALAISGLIIYIVGRQKFLNRTRGHRIVPSLSLFLGSSLFIFGLYASIAMFALIGYYHHKVADIGISYSDIFIKESPSLFWFVLWTISGIILLVDSWKILRTMDRKQHKRFST